MIESAIIQHLLQGCAPTEGILHDNLHLLQHEKVQNMFNLNLFFTPCVDFFLI